MAGLHLVSFVGSDTWKGCILKDASIQEFHDIESRTDHSCVFAQAVGFRERDICTLQGMDDAELAFDLMCGLGKQFAWWLLSQYISTSIGCAELVGRIRLTEAKLRHMSVIAPRAGSAG